MSDREPSKASESIQHSLANRETVAPSGLEDSTPTGSGPFTALPSQFGRYRVTKLLGYGAMGTVYLAFDPELNREVALKIPKADLARDPALWERFQREARAAGDLDFPSICGMYEVGQIDGTHYISMQYIDGRPLSEFVSDNQAPRKVAGVVRKLALGLAHAHERGIVHRDLKPANVMIDTMGDPVIMDFGLARRLEMGGDVRATQSGMIVGSPAYMSPEQAKAEHDQIGPRTDIYGLGVLFFELLTGSLPFRGPMVVVLGQIATQPPPKPSSLRADVDPRLESLCLKMLEKQPQNRPSSMTEVAQTLTDWLKGGGSSPEIALREAASPTESVALTPAKPAAPPRTTKVDGIEAQKQRVTDLLDKREYGAAIELLDKITNLRDARFAPLVAWARPQLKEARAAEQNVRQASAPSCDTARQLLKHYDYVGVIQVLEQVPPTYRSVELRDLLEEVTNTRDECDHLQRDIEEAARTRDTEVLPGLVKRLYKLKPNNKAIKQLAADLKQYGAAKVIALCKGQRRIFESNDRAFETKHIVGSIAIVAAVFLGVSLLVRTYLAKSGPSAPFSSRDQVATNTTPATANPNDAPSDGSERNQPVQVTPTNFGDEVFSLGGHTGHVYCVVFSPDGRWIASAGVDQTVRIWNAVNGQEVRTIKAHTDIISSIAFSADGKRLASASYDQTVKVWNPLNGEEVLTMKGNAPRASSVAFSADGRRLASAIGETREDQMVKVWDATKGDVVFALKGHSSAVSGVAFSADGKRLASASYDHTARLWNAESGQEMITLKGHTDSVQSVTFSVDGNRLASASWDQTIKIWDTANGQELLTLKGHTGVVGGVAFSADGKRLASGSNDRTVKLWDAINGQELLTLKGHSAEVGGVAFGPDGKRLASASADGTIKVWDVTPRTDIPVSKPIATPVAMDLRFGPKIEGIRTCVNGGHLWRFSFVKPKDVWMSSSAEATSEVESWGIGRSGFGGYSNKEGGLSSMTQWIDKDFKNIWLRTTVDLPESIAKARVTWDCFLDGSMEVIVNGKSECSEKGYQSRRRQIVVAESSLKPGRNVICVRAGDDGTSPSAVDLAFSWEPILIEESNGGKSNGAMSVVDPLPTAELRPHVDKPSPWDSAIGVWKNTDPTPSVIIDFEIARHWDRWYLISTVEGGRKLGWNPMQLGSPPLEKTARSSHDYGNGNGHRILLRRTNDKIQAEYTQIHPGMPEKNWMRGTFAK